MDIQLIELLNATICQRTLSEYATETDWQRCYDMALRHGVLAMTFPVMSTLPKEQRPSFTLWSKWLAYNQSIARQSYYKKKIVEKIGSWLAAEGLSTTILKGFSLSALYPNPFLREFSDIDIFSGGNFKAVNACFARQGVKVESVDGHHAYLKVDGVSLEHHFAFHNTKVENGLEGPEDTLQQLVVQAPKPTAIAGIYFPNPLFTAMFVGWHAYEHFLQEKIQIRHVVDWFLSLRQLSESEAKTLNELKCGTHWGLFADVMTSISMRKLNLPSEWLPFKDLDSTDKIAPELVHRVWNDILNSPNIPRSGNSTICRILIANRILKNSWKFKEYSNLSSIQLLMKEFVGHFKIPNSKTDAKL